MEMCSGAELFDKVKETKSFNEEQTQIVVFKIVKAIYYSHLEGITHRDLKLENIMFENTSDDAQIKIIDWGLSAKFVKDQSRMSTITGTPQFIAPEVFKGCYDSQCDIWSIGVITYVIIVWKYPHKGTNVKDYLQSLKQDEVRFDYPVFEKITEKCKDFIRKCLKQDPRERMNIQECFEHSWFTDLKLKMKSANLDESVLLNLKNYKIPKSKIHLFIERNFINLLYEPNEIKELRNQFQAIDLNGQGFINTMELKEAYKRANINLDDEELEEIVERIDKRKNNKLDYSEFLIAAIDESKLIEKKNLIKVFNYFDEDNSGFIDITNLRSLLLRTMHRDKLQSDEEFSEIIKEVASHGDTKVINLDDFLSFFGYGNR